MFVNKFVDSCPTIKLGIIKSGTFALKKDVSVFVKTVAEIFL